MSRRSAPVLLVLTLSASCSSGGDGGPSADPCEELYGDLVAARDAYTQSRKLMEKPRFQTKADEARLKALDEEVDKAYGAPGPRGRNRLRGRLSFQRRRVNGGNTWPDRLVSRGSTTRAQSEHDDTQ